MNEKLTVLAINGESYDIWDASAVKTYKFSNLYTAVAAINSDTFTGEIPAVAAVSVIRFGPGTYRVDILSDLTETQPVEINCSVDLHLNGKALNFNIPESTSHAIKLSADGIFTVNGQVSGSTFRRIVAESDTAGTVRHGIYVNGGTLTLKGGTYRVEGHSAATKQSTVVALRTGAMEAAGCTFFSSGPAINNRYCILAAGEKVNVFTDCVFQLEPSSETGLAAAFRVQSGKHQLNRCEITTNGATTGGYGVHATNSDIAINNSTVNTTGQENGGTGIYVLNCTVTTDNVNVLTNGLTDGGMGICSDNSILNARQTSAVCNGPINYGTCIYLANTSAFMTGCYANAGHTGILVATGSSLSFRDGLIRGFTHSLYCTHSPESHCYIKDSTLECRNSEDMPLCIDTPNVHKCCCYIGLYGDIGQTVHFDGCTFKSGNDVGAIDEAIVLRGNDVQETTTTACLSNCTILLNDPTPFRLEAGKTAINIGVNTVDGLGNPITQAKVHPGTGGVDSVPENLHVTGALYRKLADGECCTGKDMEIFGDYYSALLETNETTEVASY